MGFCDEAWLVGWDLVSKRSRNFWISGSSDRLGVVEEEGEEDGLEVEVEVVDGGADSLSAGGGAFSAGDCEAQSQAIAIVFGCAYAQLYCTVSLNSSQSWGCRRFCKRRRRDEKRKRDDGRTARGRS